MLKIERSCSQRIITAALKHPSSALLGLLDANGLEFTLFPDQQSLSDALAAKPGAIVVHNQNPGAKTSIAAMDLPDDQLVIEIREETKGVLGLLATRYGDQSHVPMEW